MLSHISKDENNSVISSVNKEFSGNESNVNNDEAITSGSSDPHPQHKVDM